MKSVCVVAVYTVSLCGGCIYSLYVDAVALPARYLWQSRG